MKKLNKMISILITVAMLITSMGMTATVMADSATEAGTDSNLLFELDLSDGKIADGTGNSSVETSEIAPEIKTDSNGNSYLHFDNAQMNYIGIDKSENGTALINNKETTVEFWYRGNALEGNYAKVFTLGDYTTTNENGSIKNSQFDSTWRMETWLNNNVPVYTFRTWNKGVNNDANNKAASIIRDITELSDLDEWHHYVITRNFDKENDKSQALYSLYIDGQKVINTLNVLRDSENIRNKSAKEDDELAKFWFGSFPGRGANESTNGDITGIKIYNKALSFGEAIKSYNEKVDSLKNSNTSENFDKNHKIFDLRINSESEPNVKDSTSNIWLKDTTSTEWGAQTLKHYGSFNAKDGSDKKIDYIDFHSKANLDEKNNGQVEYFCLSNGQTANNIITPNDFAVEMWVMADELNSSNSRFFSLNNSINKQNHWTLEFNANNNGTFRMTAYNGKYSKEITGISNMIDRKWVHIVASRTNDVQSGKITFNVYLNGNKVIDNYSGDYDSSRIVDNVNIGNGYFDSVKSSPESNFDGKIAKTKMYNKALTDELVKEKYNEDVKLYRTEDEIKELEATGFRNTAVVFADPANYTGANNPFNVGTWRNNVGVGTFENKSGKTVNYFDYSDPQLDFFSMGNDQLDGRKAVVNQKKLSVEMWVKADDILEDSAYHQRVFHIQNGHVRNFNNLTWALVVKDGKIQQYNYGGAAIGNGVSLADYKGEFVHVVMTREVDATAKTITYKMYFNGELKDTNTITVEDDNILTNPDYDTLVGGKCGQSWFLGDNYWESLSGGSVNNYFTGGIGEFRAYQSIVDDDMAKKLYDYEKSTYEVAKKLEVEDIQFWNSDEEIINQLSSISDGKISVAVDLKNTAKELKKAFVTLAIYSDDGKLEAVAVGADNGSMEVASGETSIFVAALDNLTLTEGSTAKVFIWSADDDSFMKPCEIKDGVVTELAYAAQEGA